ncbi:uncharacterized protein DS421_2g37860 [Arachis hypogaea]|nr:uncharacterized protein DS421_2g37860 [Arachis hypogaea]
MVELKLKIMSMIQVQVKMEQLIRYLMKLVMMIKMKNQLWKFLQMHSEGLQERGSLHQGILHMSLFC